MSARDYTQHRHELAALIGRKCFLTLATNSIKLHIDENKKGGAFLWIDPPWQFGRDGDILESSNSYPDHQEAGCEEKHRTWCSRFGPVYETLIEKIDAQPDGSLWI